MEGHNTMKCTNSVSQFSCHGFSFRVIAVCLLALWSAAAIAQVTSGTITGEVKDPSGAVIPNANVTVNAPEIGVTRNVTSNNDGVFVVPNLPPGTYNITVEAQGFKKLEKTNVVLTAAGKLSAGDFVMSIGGGDSSVTVSAEAAQLQLQAESGERSDLISSKQINNLAMNGRNILDLVKVIPGVVSSFDGQVAGTGGIDAFNINGTRANQHEFTIDGASNVDTGNNGGTHVTLNPDAIAEVKILTSNYQAEYGKAGGGQIAVVTKSGTNEFHGNGRFFHRHEGLNANGWFNKQAQLASDTPTNQPPLYRYNYFGYQFGGPVLIPGTSFNKNRDRLYFFWSQEFYRQLIPGGFETFRVPTALERVGDFSQSLDGDGNPITIYNPETGLPFAGNIIDRNALSPDQQLVFDQVSKILSLYDLPNVSGNNSYNYASQLSYDNPRREDVLRLDYQLSTNHRLYGRWINNITEFESPMQTWNLNCMGMLQYPGGCLAKNPSWNLSVNFVSTLSPTLVNEMSFGPSVTRSSWEGNNGNTSRAANGVELPMLFPVTPETNVPDLSFNGNNYKSPWSYLGANPWFQANTTINFNDNLTKVIGSHALKFGVFYQRARKDQIAWGNSNGQISFSNCSTAGPGDCTNSTGSAYASGLLGYFTSFSQTSSRPIGYFRYTNLEFFAQDTWKLTPRLTLDYGMRFAWYQPQYDKENQLAVFDPESYDPAQAVRLYRPAVGGGAFDPANPGVIVDGSLAGTVVPNSGNLLNGMQFASDGYFKGGWDDRGVMPEPRVGFAYDLFGGGNTVLRGGFGMLHDRIQGNLIFNPVFNNPRNVTTPTISNGNIADIQNLSQGYQPVISGIIAAERSGKVPTVYNYSFGIQHAIGAGTTLDLAYVGSVSRHLVTARNLQQLPYETAFSRDAQDPSKYEGGIVPDVEPGLPTAYTDAGFNYSGNYALDPQYLVPYQGYGNVMGYYKFDGTANYNSLQVSVQRRFTQGLTFGAAYTWSKSLTTANRDEDYQDTFGTRQYDYRVAEWDRPHVLVINYVYDLPNVTKRFGGPKWLSYFTDNFQLSGITTFESGAPLDTGIWWSPAMTISGTYNAWWTNWCCRAGVYPIIGSADTSIGSSKYDPSQIIAPNIGAPIGASRASLRGGGLQNWDMSLFKNIPLGSNEQRYIQLRLEAFNVFNHPNFNNVNLNWEIIPPSGTSAAIMKINTREPGAWLQGGDPCSGLSGSCFGEYNGQYSGTGGPRVLQLGAKIYF